MRRFLIAGLVAVSAVACSNSQPSDSPAASASLPAASASLPAVSLAPLPAVSLEPLKADFENPIAGAALPGTDSLLIAERAGRVILVTRSDAGQVTSTETALDIEKLVGSTDAERGLLGIAVRPDGSELFLSYTSSKDGSSQLDSYKLNGATVEPSSRKSVLSVEQPYENHNGGHIAFGPDGFLYMSLGDGGSSGDPDGNAQNREVLLGKILRLDPDAEQAVAADNPFANTPGAQPQIWLTGVRNPWRFSFDSATGDLWVGDVGQNQTEEINFLPASQGAGRGANLGWDIYEGTAEFEDPNPATGASSAGPFTQPLVSYSHDEGCSVTGGVVYRGKAIPALQGAYLYTDFCNPEIKTIRPDPEPRVEPLGVELASTVGFFEDSSGEILVISLTEGVFQIVDQT
ncbi:MAG: PQQ-dependent sugar dehydrogenase [Actinobacteria bacterium]|nr:PQQ-dependent sugar dehydrogenase [Actinomycetota bacterium]